jgi:hypothetical protein
MGRAAIGESVAQTTEIIDYGRITDQEWKGGVSASSMIKTGRTSQVTIDEAVACLEEFYVPVNASAKTRCIDGRHDPDLDEENLGPQVPGGAPGAALAYRLGVDKDDLTRGTFLVDAEAMIGNYIRMGFAPGGHRDEYSQGQKMAGCGAIDGMDQIIATMTQPELVNDQKRVTSLILGDDFDRDNYLHVLGAAVTVNGRSEDYFRDREAVLDVLESRSKDSTATLKGEHQECLVAVNLVPETTLASNRFSESFKGIQAFGYDLWWSKEVADRLMPRPEEAQDRARFVMARVMVTVATLMSLTDGSQKFVIRTEVPATEE